MKLYAYLILLVFIIFSSYITARAQSEGAISTSILQKLEKGIKDDDYTRAMINAVSNNDLKKLALNREKLNELDHHFAYRIETGKVTDQKSSGRCWLFTALNVLRPTIIRKNNMKDFQFSENYLFFYDQLEKANLFLENIIATRDKKIDDREVEWLFKNAIDDGGVWSMMVSLVEKYGMVPKEAMQEAFSSENTRMMNRLVKRKLREGGIILRELYSHGKSIGELRIKKGELLSDVYRMLVICLGQPPQKFKWRYEDKEGNLSQSKEYTPMRFYKDFVRINLDDYVLLMNDPSKEYFKLYEIEYDRNVYEGNNWTFINLPAHTLKDFAKKSILSNDPMYFSCDVGKQLNTEDGYLTLDMYDYESIFGVKFEMDKKGRIISFESGSTHGMALMGVDTNHTGEPIKWLLENSWGPEKGYEGYLTMTDEWFDAFMFRIVVRKKFVSEKVLEALKQKPIKLPPWDPMF